MTSDHKLSTLFPLKETFLFEYFQWWDACQLERHRFQNVIFLSIKNGALTALWDVKAVSRGSGSWTLEFGVYLVWNLTSLHNSKWRFFSVLEISKSSKTKPIRTSGNLVFIQTLAQNGTLWLLNICSLSSLVCTNCNFNG